MASGSVKSVAWTYLGEFDVSDSCNLPSNYLEAMIIGSVGSFEWETVQVIFPKGYVNKNISAIGKNNTVMVAYISASGTVSVITASSASNVTKYRLYYR